MHAKILLHKLLGAVIHQKRVKVLGQVIDAVIKTKQLKLTSLGRSLDIPIQERSGIRKVDRLLKNDFFQTQNKVVYGAIAKLVVGSKGRPIIIVDWTKLPNVNEYALSASLATEGRATRLYEEVHPRKKAGNRTVQHMFLRQLKLLLPPCTPIVIADAGFKNPWFKEIVNLGWDYIGRVRGVIHYDDGKGFQPCANLHRLASEEPTYLGEKTLARKNKLLTNFYIVKAKLQGRKSYTRSGKRCVDKDSVNYGRSYREPWLLVSSIKGYGAAKKVAGLYRRRMGIEEAFRDIKSTQYGFSLQENKTMKRERLIVWLLLSALASLLAWIVGYRGEALNLHYQFQANSIRHRRVLSFFYLGCQIMRKKMPIALDLKHMEFEDGGHLYAV